MKISESWIREWVNPTIDTAELVHLLTMAGLEVDGVEPAAPDFSGVVVGQIESIEAHPDAEKLRVCTVTDGQQSAQVVCGAANAAAGLKVPFAQVGAKLVAGDGKTLEIKQAKLRGVESAGMLCGASELGLEDVVDGLLVLPDDAELGKSFKDYLGLDDQIIEVDLTPNRGDCLSVLGIAREVGVITGAALTLPQIAPVPATIDDCVGVTLSASDYCPRYCGRVIRDVNVSAETPIWMREKLRRAGLRCIDPVVDITNYVLLELGQPMHAFDLDKIDSEIQVRYAAEGEKLKLLDDSELEASASNLLIADASKPLALAGIMGGAESAVGAETTHILLESAFFVPHMHAGKAREHGLHTDSSHRFERGVDREHQLRAIERATALVLEICGGQAGPIVDERAEHTDEQQRGADTLNFRASEIERVLGFSMPADDVQQIFERLGFSPVTSESGWQITVPSHRFDIAIEADLLEEIARIYGYDRLPVEPPLAAMNFTLQPESQRPGQKLRDSLLSRGFSEVINYSFIDPGLHQSLFGDAAAVELTNPISQDMSTMRVSLLPGLLKSAGQNLKRQQSRLKIFELGSVFLPGDDGLKQQNRIAGLLIGTRHAESWLSKREAVQSQGKSADNFDFYDIKSEVSALLLGMGSGAVLNVEFRPLNSQAGDALSESGGILDQLMHPGQSAAIYLNNQYLGFCGGIHPVQQKTLDEVTSAWVFELDLDLISQKKVPEFKELSKYPEVRRDIAIIVDGNLGVGEVLRAARDNAGEAITDVRIFDQYSGEGVEDGHQSIAIGLTWQHSQRTLTEDEVNASLDNVIASLSEQFNASLR